MSALTNAQRQAAYRARWRNGVSAGAAQDEAVTERPMDLAVRMAWFAARIREGKANPYVLHCCRVRYGCDWVRQCVTQ